MTPEINAISTFLLLATFVLVLLSQRLQQGKPGKATIAAAMAVVVALGAFAIGGPVREAGRRTLSVYIWSNYLSDKIVKDFADRYNVDVHVELYDSNEALLAKLQTGVANYDIVVPSDYMVEILSRGGLLEPIDTRQLTNFGNLSPRFVGLPYDPENRYSLPFVWGTTGIGYRRDRVGHEIKHWSDLWDPQLKDRVGMLNDVRETFGAALKSLGYSENTTDPDEIAKAAELLMRQKPLVRTYDSDTFADTLLAGEVWATQGYNGQIAKAAAEDPEIEYVIPEEGCTLWVDNMCIPKGTQNPDLAMLFINFILEGQIGAAVTEETGYSTPNRAAIEYLPPELRDNTIIVPPDSALDRCETFHDLGPDIEIYDRYWTKIKS